MKICSDICPRTLSVPRSEQFSEIEARGNWTVSYEEQMMSKDKYKNIFSPQMETIVFIILPIFSATHAVPALQIYQALILPHFDYCSPARVITRSSYETSASIILKRLNWDNLSTRRKKLMATLMFKIIKGLSLAYLQDLFSIRSTPYNLRDSEIKLNLPKPRTNYCKRALGFSGALLWNSLPVNLRKSDSFGYSKRELDKFFSNCQSCSHTAIL